MKKDNKLHDSDEICKRIAKVRLEVAGPRGKSAFAKQLSLSASTYDYYEFNRVPPANVLLKIADLSGVSLRWLITGQDAPSAVSIDNPVLRRAADMLSKYPKSAAAMGAFLDLLEARLTFPDAETGHPQNTGDSKPAINQKDMNFLIPILGRTAAGIPAFWKSGDKPEGITHLADLITDMDSSASSQPAKIDFLGSEEAVSIISLNKPHQAGAVSFVRAKSVKEKFSDAFALQIDGNSMCPEYNHGDIVILSPSVPAQDGKPAVVQLENQIGVTCKLFRREGSLVHLIPINETLEPQTFEQSKLIWSLKVLAKIACGS